MMPEPNVPPEVLEAANRSRRRRRRWWRALLILTVLFIASLVGWYFYNRYHLDVELQEAIAETDRLDPGWRLEDIERRRAALPDDQNAAIPIKAAVQFIKSQWSANSDFDQLAKLYPPTRIEQGLMQKLRESLRPYQPAAALATQAISLKSGHYVLPTKRLGPFEPHVTDIQNLGTFLSYFAMIQIEDEDFEGAWQTALAILACDRSLGEPTSFTFRVRMELRSLASITFQRCSAQGVVSDASLSFASKQIANSMSEPIVYDEMRGLCVFT